MEVHEQLRLYPAVNGLHRRIVRRRPCPRHRTRNAIHRQKVIERLGRIDGALVGMKHHLALRMLLANLEQVLQPADVRHSVTALGRKGMAYNLVVPEIHVQRQFIVHSLRIERCHITDNTLQWTVDLNFREKQIREYAVWISRLLVLVMLCLALDPGHPAAFVRIWIGEDQPCVQAEFGVEPPVTMGWVFVMVFLEQKDVADKVFLPFRGSGEFFLPAIETASLDTNDLAKCLDRKLAGKLQDYLVFLLTYRITEPSPFTS